MKRTDREKDWPFATALGEQMLEAGDPKGWLHVFEDTALLDMAETRPIPSELIDMRPLLRLVIDRDTRLRGAVHAEKMFWHELDRVRIGIARNALRPYVNAVRKARANANSDFNTQHEIRLTCAQDKLPINPLAEYGIKNLTDTSRRAVKQIVRAEHCQWLPDVGAYFTV